MQSKGDIVRTLFEIIDAAKDGEMPTHEECYWAMLAFDALMYFDHHDMQNLVERPQNVLNNPKSYYEKQFRRHKTALNTSPKDWVGPNNDPSNPAYQSFRNVGKKLIDKVLGDTDETKAPPEGE